MILLQSKDLFDDILILDPETGEYRALKRSSSPEFSEAPIGGSFADIEGHQLMLYRVGEELRFSMDDKVVVVDDDVNSTFGVFYPIAIFTLKNRGVEEVSFKYKLSDLQQPILGDTTAHIGEEDFDFCLFVHNVLNDPERRRFIYRVPRNL